MATLRVDIVVDYNFASLQLRLHLVNFLLQRILSLTVLGAFPSYKFLYHSLQGIIRKLAVGYFHSNFYQSEPARHETANSTVTLIRARPVLSFVAP